MAVLIERKPWLMLDEWRGKMFTDEWPTLPQLFFISAERFPNRPCFTDFEGEGGAKNKFLSVSSVWERWFFWLCFAP